MNILKSIFLKIALGMGAIMYLSYAIPTGSFTNPYLIGISTFTALFLPVFTLITTKLELISFHWTGSLFLSKISKLIWQSIYNFFALWLLVLGKIVFVQNLQIVGGLLGAVILTSFASQGLQYFAIYLADHDKGNRFLNIFCALSFNMIVSAFAALGYQTVQVVFVIIGLVSAIVGVFYSLATDVRAMIPSKGGIGLFLGTFNPVHKTHLKILKRFIEKRQLEKVYWHPTIIPKMHQYLLEKGMIQIVKEEAGKRFYEKTEKGDPLLDFFPTGSVFYEAENRLLMLKVAIREAGLEDKVEVIYFPETYQKHGFYGVIDVIRKQHPHQTLHGLLGTDEGGLILRSMYEEKRVKPFVTLRRDQISGTAIRKGAKGMTTDKITEILEFLDSAQNGQQIDILGKSYHFVRNRLEPKNDQ
jgi:nicotinic acid mononucleotide adenylyltransferase